jgi:hypothetical protein
MLQSIIFSAAFIKLVAAIPAPWHTSIYTAEIIGQVSGYIGANFPITPSQAQGSVATSFGPDSVISAIVTKAPPAPPRVSSNDIGVTSHGPYSGTPTTTGAVQASTTLAASIKPKGLNPTATYYNGQGVLMNAAPAPYTPNGITTFKHQ